jgi:outer membrane lipoprotein SlyB
MSARNIVSVFFLSTVTVLSACSSSPPRNESAVVPAPVHGNATQFGYVSGIDVVPVATRTSGGGAVLGAVLGAVIGHQIGSGHGRDAATGVGVVGGAVIGNQIEKRNKAESDIYRVSVRMDNGSLGQFDYQRIDDLRVGDRVKVEAGQLHRV